MCSGRSSSRSSRPKRSARAPALGFRLSTASSSSRAVSSSRNRKSARERGSSFTFPSIMLRKPRGLEMPARRRRMNCGAAGQCLLVEDEPMVRSVAERALTRHGYKVMTADNGEEALDIVNRGDTIDLLISDVVMPGHGRADDGSRGSKDAPRPKDPVHVGLCRGAAQKIDRHRKCELPSQAILGDGACGGCASNGGDKIRSLTFHTPNLCDGKYG